MRAPWGSLRQSDTATYWQFLVLPASVQRGEPLLGTEISCIKRTDENATCTISLIKLTTHHQILVTSWTTQKPNTYLLKKFQLLLQKLELL